MKLRMMAMMAGILASMLSATLPLESQTAAPLDLALRAKAQASSSLDPRYAAGNAVDGVVSDEARWVSARKDSAPWLELDLGQPRAFRCVHVYSGWEDGAAIPNFELQAWRRGEWRLIPGGEISGNTQQARSLTFEKPVSAQRIRFVAHGQGPARLRELAVFSEPQPLGTSVIIATEQAAPSFPANRHIVALNQVGFETGLPKRFTAPLSPDGSRFEVRRVGSTTPLFSGAIQGHIGDFSSFRPLNSRGEYKVVVTGGGLQPGNSDPFAIRENLFEQQFWQTAVDFMIDDRSVVGTHPSAYGGCPWRDGTYYDFAVPSLVLLYLADPVRVRQMPVRMNWRSDKERVLSPDFRFDANNPNSEGVMDAVRRYYAELAPPNAGAPDVVQLIHWGLGYYLFHPETRDPSGDPLPKQLQSQTLEQFAFPLYAWPQLRQWLPQDFYNRCHDFAFAHWEQAGLLKVDPLWDAKTYQVPQQMQGPNPTGGSLHPYKGRHAPGHSIMPNLLVYEVAIREGREDAALYLKAAQEQTQWIIDNLDWEDPRTTKGQRMSEYKTMTSLVWFFQHYPAQAPSGLKSKIAAWARIMLERSDNMWDFRRYDLDKNWTIPKLNEPGNLVSFTASAIAASGVVDDPGTKQRLVELAVAQMDNVFGRNPKLAAAPHHPEKGFPLVERGWPVGQPDNTCARLETTRGSLSASPGTEMYPFNPNGRLRHPEGWVNFNAAWNVALAWLRMNETQSALPER